MAKPNYQFEKRQKELAKKNKKEEKRQKKVTDNTAPDDVREASLEVPDDITTNPTAALRVESL